MAHAQQAERLFPAAPVFRIQATIVVAIVVAVLAFAALGPAGLVRFDDAERMERLVQAERAWELQRLQQSGWIDPVTRSARDWEDQRRKQSGQFD